MDDHQAKAILDKILQQVFGTSTSMTLEQSVKKFAFDVQLPYKVKDSTDGSDTWATSANSTKYVKKATAIKNEAAATEGLYATEPIKDLEELLAKWDRINFTSTEFAIDSLNISQSDLIMQSENVFRSSSITRSKNVLYSDLVFDSEFVFACQNSGEINFCLRVNDSLKCASSFGVTRSTTLTNCIMMHDCADMQDSMFCSNMRGQRFCIANMQYEEAEYKRLREQVVQWILSPQS